jgi:hypothetical protein
MVLTDVDGGAPFAKRVIESTPTIGLSILAEYAYHLRCNGLSIQVPYLPLLLAITFVLTSNSGK